MALVNGCLVPGWGAGDKLADSVSHDCVFMAADLPNIFEGKVVHQLRVFYNKLLLRMLGNFLVDFIILRQQKLF